MEECEFRISVIIPIYNMGKYIENCLESIIKQTLKEIEIICIDDGSTDNSLLLLKKYRKKDRRIIILQQKNRGAGLARNTGIRIAKGKYVAFMDPDDWYPGKNILEILFENASENQALICGGRLLRSTKPGKYIKNIDEYDKDMNEGFIIYKDYQNDSYFTTYIYDLSMLKENDIYFSAYRRFDDPPFFVKAMITAQKFYRINKDVYVYRLTNKKVNWDKKKANDLVSAITENIILSKKYKLEKLHNACLEYIEEKMFFCIMKNFNEENLKMNYLLLKANDELDLSLINSYRKKNSKKIILSPLKIGIRRYQSLFYYTYILYLLIKKIRIVFTFVKRYGWIYTFEKIKISL